MKLIKVAAGVLNQTPLDWQANKANILAAIEAARHRGVSILCLPELCITGYGCEDAFHAPGVQRTAREVLQEIVPATEDMIVSLGLPLLYGGGLFNTACLVVNQHISVSSPSRIWPARAFTTNLAGSNLGRRKLKSSSTWTAAVTPWGTSSSNVATCGSVSRSAKTLGSRIAREETWRRAASISF